MRYLIAFLALGLAFSGPALGATADEVAGWGTPKSGVRLLGFVRAHDIYSGVDLPGAQVTLVESGLTIPVGANALYQFYNMPAGTYTVRASHPGYIDGTCVRVIEPGATEDQWCSIALIPGTNPDPDPVDPTPDPVDPTPDPDDGGGSPIEDPEPEDTGLLDTDHPYDPDEPLDTGNFDELDDTGEAPADEDEPPSGPRREPGAQSQDFVEMKSCAHAPALSGGWLPLMLWMGLRFRGSGRER